ncbi:MAG: transglutaminase family protein [Nibricoccus sp.]
MARALGILLPLNVAPFASKVWVVGFAFCLLAVAHALGAPRAVIVVGLTAGETQAVRLRSQAETVRTGLIARGLTPENIRMLGQEAKTPVRREAILEALKTGAGAAVAEETWLVLLGTVAPSRDGAAAFQISGPRLTSADLATALEALPGKKFVFVGAAGGGAMLPSLLSLREVDAVAATSGGREINEPRFTQFWADLLVEKPQTPFLALAVEASKRVAAYYAENKLALGEHACAIDPEQRRLVEAPFEPGVFATVESTRAATDSTVQTERNVSDIEIPKFTGDLEIERKVATPETQQLLAEALALAKGSEHTAIVIAEKLEVTVGRNFSTLEKWRKRVLVRTAEAIDDVATLVMLSNPPYLSTNLVAARVILPTGEQILVNPRAASARASQAREEQKSPGEKSPAGPPIVELPEVVAGCLVDVEWVVERRSSASIPEYYKEWDFAGTYPVVACSVQLTIPTEEKWRFFAHAFPKETKNESDSGQRTVVWELRDLPARSFVAGDLPRRATAPWLGVSSLPSWESFAEWYRRLASGADEVGPSVKELAAQIGRDHADRAGRIRAAFERVTTLRYVATEMGVGGLRPRTPEQVWQQRYGDCKDKANLLVAVLRLLGIEAGFVLVNRGDVTFTEFPGWQFNHAIAHVPAAPTAGQPADLWLDSTDRLVPFGVIAPGDLGREALVFPKNGAANFMKILAAQEPASEWKEIWKLSPGLSGISLVGSLTLSASGAADTMLRRSFSELTPTQRVARLQEWFGVPALTIESVSVGDAYDLAHEYHVEAKVRVAAHESLPLRPPELGRIFQMATRSGPFQISEGRATRYVQQISWGGETEKYLSDHRRDVAGFIFRRAEGLGGRRCEISTPGGLIAPEAYAELRQAWQDFNLPKKLSTHSP